MYVNITRFLEDPHLYVVREGRGHKAFEWLVTTLGVDTTVTLFADIIYAWIADYYIQRGRFPKETHDISNKWVSARSINDIATWGTTPQGGSFWAVLDALFNGVCEPTPDTLEDLRNKAYLVKR